MTYSFLSNVFVRYTSEFNKYQASLMPIPAELKAGTVSPVAEPLFSGNAA